MVQPNFTNFHNIEYQSELWQQCLEEIRLRCQKDSLYENYRNLNPESYLFFNGLVYDKKIVAFAGIEHSPHKWGFSIARVLTRYWIHPNFRSHSLTKWTAKKIKITPLILTPQIDFLKTLNYIKAAFITRHGNYKKGLQQFLKITNMSNDCNFYIVDGQFNVCEPMNKVPESCKQIIAVTNLKNFDWSQYLETIQKQGMLKRVK